MNKQVTAANSNKPQAIPKEEMVSRFIALQEKEVINRQHELEMRRQQDSNSFEYAKLALQAQLQDSAHNREHQQRQQKIVFRFILIIVALVLLFMGVCVFRGNPEIAMEIIKAIVFILSGGAGGYALASRKQRDDYPSRPEE